VAVLLVSPLLVVATPAGAAAADHSRVVRVSTAAELAAAMAAAQPGDTIRMADGEYRGEAFTTVSGTPSRPITLVGSRRAVIVNDWFEQPTTPCPSGHTGYGVWLDGASHWRLHGFTVADSKKGIVVDRAKDVIISGVSVHHTADEAVHFRRSTTDSAIIGSTIHTAGLVQPGFGEGVYIGSAYGNWRCHGQDGGPDASNRIRVIGNRFGPNIAAEHIDIKEGTTGGQVIGNVFDGCGLTGKNSGDSWVDAKGSDYLFVGNVGTYRPSEGSVFTHGYETHEQYNLGYGCGNVFRGNLSHLAGVGGYAVNVTNQDRCAGNPNVVYNSNLVFDAVEGLTNIPITPEPGHP